MMTERQGVGSGSRPRESFAAKIAAVCGRWYYERAELNEFLSGGNGSVCEVRQPGVTRNFVIVIRVEEYRATSLAQSRS